MIYTAEFVSPKHPDKICDFIADSILDQYLNQDKNARVAVEVMGGHGAITVSGEVTSKAAGVVDIEQIIREIVGPEFQINVHLVPQSPEIGRGVDLGGAGDQGIMVGFACDETENFMPLEYELARNLCQEIYQVYPFDGKVQVSVERREESGEFKVRTVVASFQNTQTEELLKLVKSKIQAEEYLINPAGQWQTGGFDSDSGLSGRKLVVDAYGPRVSIGGGSFSGKDYTKVDRSGAYMARRIAVDTLQKHACREVLVQLAYAIGKQNPLMKTILLDRNIEIAIPNEYDLSPAGIRETLRLDRPIYKETSLWGHFGRSFDWK